MNSYDDDDDDDDLMVGDPLFANIIRTEMLLASSIVERLKALPTGSALIWDVDGPIVIESDLRATYSFYSKNYPKYQRKLFDCVVKKLRKRSLPFPPIGFCTTRALTPEPEWLKVLINRNPSSQPFVDRKLFFDPKKGVSSSPDATTALQTKIAVLDQARLKGYLLLEDNGDMITNHQQIPIPMNGDCMYVGAILVDKARLAHYENPNTSRANPPTDYLGYCSSAKDMFKICSRT